MASEYDTTEFVDTDFQAHKAPYATSGTGGASLRAPTREEVDTRVSETQKKLAELKRAQEELERERAGLEETRRRQMEFQTGRQEMLQQLTHGAGLLEQAEFKARRDAEQMARTLAEFREALGKIQAIREEAWSKDTFQVELTRALTTLDNARMEWNTARLKLDILNEARPEAGTGAQPGGQEKLAPLGARNLGELCKIGLALTWPLAGVALLALGVLVTLLLLRH
jgi:hypothetical protein